MDAQRLRELTNAIVDLCREAGRVILEKKQGSLDTEAKEDGSPVTIADRAAHAVIAAKLATLSPDIPIISEEDDPEAAAEAIAAQGEHLFWLVDPLDGTKEYVREVEALKSPDPDGDPEPGEYTVNIALVQKDTPVLGAIYAPEFDRSWFAAAGLGAFRQAGDGQPEPIRANGKKRKLQVVASRSHFSDATKAFVAGLAREHQEGEPDLIQKGSSVKICAVAEGAADIYPRLGPTMLWDTAAGAIVAREAGCEVVDLDGHALAYGLEQGLRHQGFVVFSDVYFGLNYLVLDLLTDM